MQFKGPRRRVLSEDIRTEILAMIKSGEIKPGDKLPPEREMAAAMSVSRPSLREAMHTLAFMGIVEIIQGDGIYVTTLQPELLVEHLDVVFALEDYTFLQLLEARKIIEPGFAELAAQRVQEADLSELKALVEESAKTVGDKESFAQTDMALHRKIAQIAQNPILNHLMASMDRLGQASRSRTTDFPHIRQQTVDDHHAIVEAIAARDSEAARDAMIRHLIHVEEGLKHALPAAAAPQNSDRYPARSDQPRQSS